MENEDDVLIEGEEDHSGEDRELVASVEPSDEWTNFRNSLANNMFNAWSSHVQ